MSTRSSRQVVENLQCRRRPILFSSIPLDQAHEQNNELIKGDCGIIGITENPGALLKWMVAGPELARVVKEFESTVEEVNTDHTAHLTMSNPGLVNWAS